MALLDFPCFKEAPNIKSKQLLLIVNLYQHLHKVHPQTLIAKFKKTPCMEFYHLYAWWFQFHHSQNKTGMASPTQYFWNLRNPLNISCRLCLPIGLECSPQLLYWNLSAPVWLFHSGLWSFPTNLFSWICHGWLDREVMVFLFCPISIFLYPKMTF